MTKIDIISGMILSTALVTTPVFAARNKTQQAIVEGGTFASSAIAGTVAGGPIGFIIGALGGAFLAKQTRVANSAELSQYQATVEVEKLTHTISEQRSQITLLEEETVDKLTFQVMFATGEDTLSSVDLRRVKILAYYLEQNPNLIITLDGHADPRGTDEYNNVLSQERAQAIKLALMELGISSHRINTKGHGANQSTAQKGNLEDYAKDRRVDIQIIDHPQQNLATN